MPASRYAAVAAAVLPAVVLAAVGLTHPHVLTNDTAEYWRNIHIGLLPVFPLLAVAPWLVARRGGPVVGWTVAALGYVFAAFYTALDVLAGVGAGALQLGNGGEGRDFLFALGNDLSLVGVWAYLVASVLASAVAVRQLRLRAVPGVVLALVGAVLFLDNHIYWPAGVLSMLALAVGWGLLVWMTWTAKDAVPQGSPT